VALKAYNSPGVIVTETTSPSVSPALASPQLLAIVGEATGYQTATERLSLTNTAQTLAHTGFVAGTMVIKDGLTGVTINAGNYTITAGTDPDTTVAGDEPTTLARFASPTGAISVASTAGSGTAGTYEWGVTFVNANGETSVGANSAATVMGASWGANLTNIPIGPTGTTARNVYRRQTNGANTWVVVGTIANNTATNLTDNGTGSSAAPSSISTLVTDGMNVLVTYNYKDQFYNQPTTFDDFDDVQDKYGAAYDGSGNIASKLTFAARLAFINGATEVVCVATNGSATSDYENAFLRLLDEENLGIITVANGTAAVVSALASHLVTANARGYYRIGVAGRDGSSTNISADTLRSSASSLNSEAIRLVSPARFIASNITTGQPLYLGGQYAAAAVAGMYAARDVQMPLTRKTISGFDAVGDRRTLLEQLSDSNAGLLVIEDKGGSGILRVRHDITTAVGAVSTRESSVVRAKYEMANRIRNTLDDGVIGAVIPRNEAPLFVQGAVASVLGQLLTEEVIAGWSDLKARSLSDPTTIEVKFGYNPVYPINNVEVRFTINTNTGDFTLAG